jgi:hypothetical protein
MIWGSKPEFPLPAGIFAPPGRRRDGRTDVSFGIDDWSTGSFEGVMGLLI